MNDEEIRPFRIDGSQTQLGWGEPEQPSIVPAAVAVLPHR
jgi:hypothetical protein